MKLGGYVAECVKDVSRYKRPVILDSLTYVRFLNDKLWRKKGMFYSDIIVLSKNHKKVGYGILKRSNNTLMTIFDIKKELKGMIWGE